jgi:hypothetical protein
MESAMTKKDAPTQHAADPDDNTEVVLRSWGLSGEPMTWAPTRQQPVIAAIRAANTGFGDAAMVQGMLDATYPDGGYLAANVVLEHPPTGAFTVTDGTIDPEVDPTPYAKVIRVELTDDEYLGLTSDMVSWDFGDGTAVVHEVFGHDHGYVAPGDYTVRLTEMVAGAAYGSSQDVTVTEPVQARATKTKAKDEPFDPGEHTVAEVKEYLAEHPEEMDAVLEAEDQGKARAGILDL